MFHIVQRSRKSLAMIQILPNWHPIFVHFTIGLFSTASGFYIISYLFNSFRVFPKAATELEIAAHWCLWVAGIVVIGTVLAGFQAYNTVRHDVPSHFAMTDHRNWALPTAGAMVLVAVLSLWRTVKHKSITINFIIALILVEALLLATAWRGAELVFRYGLGVMSLPQAEKMTHQHERPKENQSNTPLPSTPKTSGHDHNHNSDDHH